jgi:serine protease Do
MKKAPLFLFALLAVAPFISAMAQTVPQSREQITLTFAPLVKQVASAVVNIYARKLVQQRFSPLFADPLFRQFFSGLMQPGLSRQRLENSLGSGVLVQPDGLIITSNHVIADADQIRVVLSDRREFDATLVTADSHADLAVLRINAKGEKLPYLELKDSDEAQIGDLVLAIGDPFGVGQTVTSGIISAVAHTSLESSDYSYFIQTDAAINPGNSGGALVTMDGKLVGINAAIYSQSGGNLGIGFAVPSNMVRAVLNAVAQGKSGIVHPWLGIEGQEVTPDIAASLNMPQPSGILVTSINSASPVGRAGLRTGDVVASVNGHKVDDLGAFHYRVATLAIGSDITLGIQRKGQKIDIQAKLIAPPEDPPREKTKVTGDNPFAGATIENLSPAVAEETGIHKLEHGVVIAEVGENVGVAANVGLQPNDVILSVNGAKIAAVSDVMNAIKQHVNSWRINLQRGDQNISIMVGG